MEGKDVPKISQKIGFIGGGNMAKAIFDGIINKKLVIPNHVYVYGPHSDRLTYFKDEGANITESNIDLVKSCDVIFICVKPYMLETVAQQIRHEECPNWENKIFVSVLAATKIDTIEKCLVKKTKLIRVMPNTPLSVGEGCCVFTPNKNVDVPSVGLITTLLESSGLCLQVPEGHINAMAAISGSGPAFMYSIIESMADGGVKMGIPRNDAIKLAAQTMLGKHCCTGLLTNAKV